MSEILLIPDIEAEDQRIIDSAMELWVSSILNMNNIIIDFYNHDTVLTAAQFILKGLTTPKHVNIRKQFGNSLHQLAMKVEVIGADQPLTYLLKLLEANIPQTYMDVKEADFT